MTADCDHRLPRYLITDVALEAGDGLIADASSWLRCYISHLRHVRRASASLLHGMKPCNVPADRSEVSPTACERLVRWTSLLSESPRQLHSREQTVVTDGERTDQGEDESEAERCTQGGHPQGAAQDPARQAAAAPFQPTLDAEAAGTARPRRSVACRKAEASEDALAGESRCSA